MYIYLIWSHLYDRSSLILKAENEMPSLLQQQDLECITSPGQMSSAWSGRKSRNNQSKTINTKLRAPNHTALSACLTAIAHNTTMLYLSTSIVLLYQNVLVSHFTNKYWRFHECWWITYELCWNYAWIMVVNYNFCHIAFTAFGKCQTSALTSTLSDYNFCYLFIYLFIYSLRHRGSTNIQNKTQSKNTKHDCDGS